MNYYLIEHKKNKEYVRNQILSSLIGSEASIEPDPSASFERSLIPAPESAH